MSFPTSGASQLCIILRSQHCESQHLAVGSTPRDTRLGDEHREETDLFQDFDPKCQSQV